MKKFLMGSIAALSIAISASSGQAADLMDAPVDCGWCGLYVGGHFGGVWADVDHDAGPGFPTSYTADGFLGGALIGFNHQFGDIVLGLEADISLGDLSGSAVNGPANPTTDDLNVAGSLRARVGFVMSAQMLLFITGGIAIADAGFSDPNQVGVTSDDQTHFGGVVGAGVEWKAWQNVSIRGEYLYTSYGSEIYGIGPTPESIEFDTHVARGAVIWHF